MSTKPIYNILEKQLAHILKCAGLLSLNQLTGSRSLASAITAAACYSFGLTTTIDRALLKRSTLALTLTGWYAYVQKAANAADRLKQQNGMYYHALYAEELEMLYFLIKPVTSRNPSLNRVMSSDDEIAAAINRLIR